VIHSYQRGETPEGIVQSYWSETVKSPGQPGKSVAPDRSKAYNPGIGSVGLKSRDGWVVRVWADLRWHGRKLS
jgi:hypothetical protein